ncbi:HNH endonuclease signature motif containing protein [Agromyces neolithicus]|uniref:HNH endonuclease n=1 Tax=Agromyces neolithicus TaxID=269420 RepID=A0ABP4XXS2_9MICO
MAETFDTGWGVVGVLDPLADIDMAVLLGLRDGRFDDGRFDDGRFDAADVGVRPSVLDVEFEFSGLAASFDGFAELCAELDAAEQALFAVNRAMAQHLAACRRALDVAARNPALYLHPGQVGAADASELAVRAAATELSMRLHVSAGTIRSRAHEAAVLHDRLPRVWARFAAGVASYVDARVAVDAAAGFLPGDARLTELDEQLAAVIGMVTTTRFRQRARTVRAKLERDLVEARHTRPYALRRVVVEHVDDGMAWVNLYTSQVDAAKISARLDATARRDAGTPREARTLDQLRADAATGWLTGAGTPTAARAEIIVTIPVLNLAGITGSATGDAGHGAGAGGGVGGGHGVGGLPVTLVSSGSAMLDGVGPIDDATARQLFADAPSFRRLMVDPITAAPLALDRTRYRPSKAQRLWLALTHGRCTRPGCDRLAVRADLDHQIDWQHGGPTNTDNLDPKCRADHRLRHATRFMVAKNTTTAWRSPTGRSYTDPPPF